MISLRVMPIRMKETISALIDVSRRKDLSMAERMRMEEAAEVLILWSEPHIIQRVDLLTVDFGYLELREEEGFTPVLIHTKNCNRDSINQGAGLAILSTGTGRFIRRTCDYNKSWRIWDEIPEKTQSWERWVYFGKGKNETDV